MLDQILRPGTSFLGRLDFRKKFLVIGLVFLLPMLTISALLLRESLSSMQFTASQRAGLETLADIRTAIELIQKHRGMSAAYLNGATDFAGPMRKLGDEVEDALQALKHSQIDGLLEPWSALRESLEQLAPEESFDKHTAVVNQLFGEIDRVGERSNLILDSSPDTYYLITLVTSSYPEVAELMGQARGIGVGVSARGEHTSTSRMTLATLQNQIERNVRSIQYSLQRSAAFRESFRTDLERFSDEAGTIISRYVQLLDHKVIQPETGMASAGEITSLATEAIDGIYHQFDRLVPLVDSALAERESEAVFLFRLTIVVLALVLLAMAYLFTAFYANVRESVTALITVTRAMAEGDLTRRAERKGNDELTEVAASLNVMAEKFHHMIRQVSASAEQTAQASEELSAVTEESAEGVRQQKQDTEQVASAMSQLSSTVRDVAENAGKSAEAAVRANGQATEGQRLINHLKAQVDGLAAALGEAADSVNSLNRHSREIGSVIEVINDIAEQTNLLALNAAIEAARAGESGRGFAVVADEVRSLARRTQSSTSSIHESVQQLQSGAGVAVNSMEHSLQESGEAVDLVNQTRAAFQEILTSVDLISEMGAQIASATEEQSAVSGEMSRNIERVAQVTEQAATSSGQIAQASNNLSALAQDLADQVARFQT